MANATVTVLEADGLTQTDVVVLDVGRQAAAASKSVAMATEDKAVFDAAAASLVTIASQTADVAHGSPSTASPVLTGGVASAAAPTNVDEGDAVQAWYLLNGARPTVITAAGALIGGDATNGLDVDVTRMAALVAGEAHVGEVGGKSIVFSATLSTDTAAYASGDLIADTQQMDAFFRKADGTGIIQSITIIDEDAQGAAIYILFMTTSTSLGAENSAPNITDANLTAGLCGIVTVETTDYITLSGAKVACIRNIGIPVKAVSGTDDLYIAVLNATGTPTYTAAGLEMRIGALLD